MSKKRILIVEDHTAIRKMLVAMFTNAGYEVVEADNGATGLQHAQAGGFTGIILDLKMPQLDGLHFLNAIKQTPPTVPNGPMIVFSSVEYAYAKSEALKAGATAFIQKDDLQSIKLVEQVEAIINSPAAVVQ
jgi:two-component system, chemotaxis family, chemotaxis protein CheY